MGARTCGAPGAAGRQSAQARQCARQRPPALSTCLTMYSAGATYSTLPPLSSGRWSASMRRPPASSAQKYSTGTSFTSWHTLQE